jgi:energy-coupling factor transporter ATP-binding protein EcfA2
LRPFQRDESDIFFGREEQTDQLLAKLQRCRFLAVVGPSGCGKSSLVRAGLMAALEAGFMTDAGPQWRVAEMRPGEDPLARLCDALLSHSALGREPVAEPEARSLLMATLRGGPLGLIEVLRERPLAPRTNLFILVDQFEEIFRFRDLGNIDRADAFVSLLLATAQQREIPVYIVITMRSDFLGDCALFTGLPEAINDGQYLTPRLTREQIRGVIVGPARVFDVDVEASLVNQLLNEMGPDPDRLPLLQHLMMRLWLRLSAKQRLGRDVPQGDGQSILTAGAGTKARATITVQDNTEVGTLGQALSVHADEVFGQLSEIQQAIAEVMFRRLTERGLGKRDIRRPARLSKIAAVAGVSVEAVKVVSEEFRRENRSFVMPPSAIPLLPDTILDIGHESLIRQWKRLNEWVDEEARSAEGYLRIKDEALRWKTGDADLLGGINLVRALAWKHLQNPSVGWASRYGSDEDFEIAMQFLHESELRWAEEVRLEKAKSDALAAAERRVVYF